LYFNIPANTTCSATVRFGAPQLEFSSYATSIIPTVGTGTASRSADVFNDQPATYFDSTGTLNFAAYNTARTNYTYSGSSWTNSGTLIEPAATNSIPNNMMVGAVAADGLERTNNGTFSTSSGNTCTGSLTSSADTFRCASSTIAAQTT